MAFPLRAVILFHRTSQDDPVLSQLFQEFSAEHGQPIDDPGAALGAAFRTYLGPRHDFLSGKSLSQGEAWLQCPLFHEVKKVVHQIEFVIF